MTNPYYNHGSGVPAAASKGTSAALRAEFDSIAAGFDAVASASSTSIIPPVGGNSGKVLKTDGATTFWSNLLSALGITSSTIDSSPIGVTAPSTGAFTSLNTSSLLVTGSLSGAMNMGGFKATNQANGTAATDSATVGQTTTAISNASAVIQTGTPTWLTNVTGTNTITASLAGLTAYSAGLTVRFTAAGANTGAVNLNIGSLGAINLVRADGVALATGDLLTSGTYEAVYDGASFKLQGSVAPSQLLTGAQIQTISGTVASNALTIGAGVLTLGFRSTTLTSGTITTVTGTPSNLVVPSGATLGTINAITSNLVVLALNNAGTIELAVVNILGNTDLTETGLISTTAISAGSTSANVVYSTTSRTSVAYRVIGRIDSTQATAGTWATTPSLIQGAGGQALTAMSSLGYGQKWTDVTASRALSTTYYNTTGKPIQVMIYAAASTANNSTLTINGVVACFTSLNSASSSVGYVVGVVPVGASYLFQSSGAALSYWAELR